jgi:hypothetical protein
MGTNTTETNNPSIFDILKNPVGELSNLEQEYTGPDYLYYKKIKTPSQLGMGTSGSFDQLGKDISGLVSYVEVLVSGHSNAQTKQTPLGNRFFLKTGAQCKDTSGNLQDRYIYIDNVPDGDIPIISSALDYNFTDFEGLVPGAISKMNDLNPAHFMRAFVTGSEPSCREVTLSTIDVDDNSGYDTKYVSDTDINDINPCNFREKINTLTNKKCQEGFSTLNSSYNINKTNMHKYYKLFNITKSTYYLALTILSIYIMIKLLKK